MTKENTTTVDTPTRLSDTMTGKLPYTLTNDYLFHIVFQRDKPLLKALLCSLLDLSPEEIVDIRLENPIYPGDLISGKEIVMDLMITLNHNQKINIELQVTNHHDWPERSLTYLSRSVDNVRRGEAYKELMPTLHISILDFTLFKDHPEFYAHYRFSNVINHTIYSDKLALNVLCLSQINLATEADILSGRQLWARIFKAKTWEELHMLTVDKELVKELPEIMAQVMADKELWLQYEAQWRREYDYYSGHKKGHSEGLSEGKNEMLSLIQKMTANGESELLSKLSDPAFLEEMYRKYQIADMN